MTSIILLFFHCSLLCFADTHKIFCDEPMVDEASSSGFMYCLLLKQTKGFLFLCAFAILSVLLFGWELSTVMQRPFILDPTILLAHDLPDYVANAKKYAFQPKVARILDVDVRYIEGCRFDGCNKDVLFLSGASFTYENWTRGNPSILDMSLAGGFRVIAVDLRGFDLKNGKKDDTAIIIEKVLETLKIVKPVIVFLSYAGRSQSSFVFGGHGKYFDQAMGFVGVSPRCPRSHDCFCRLKIPCLLVYGGNDDYLQNILLRKIPIGTITVIGGAGHAPFIDQPKVFMKILYNFLTHFLS
ncbi:hypothetical protein AB6A40_000047 [Gnathostoma spinigerum]|uniref:Uncharacterized protein n=1 Tax=Gnathostoma spinigerum TaxID=75299 RepID=A0ABD6E1E6_9BILA